MAFALAEKTKKDLNSLEPQMTKEDIKYTLASKPAANAPAPKSVPAPSAAKDFAPR